MNVHPLGPQDVYFERYDEWLSITRAQVVVRNLVFGNTYIDVTGTANITNYKTGETGFIKFIPSGWSVGPKIEGKIFDSSGKEIMTVKGSWYDQIHAVDLRNGHE